MSLRIARNLLGALLAFAFTMFILSVSAFAQTESVLYTFTGGSDGSGPSALIQGLDGVFYGTTANGGSSNLGTAFKF